jgi:hypothetical protein
MGKSLFFNKTMFLSLLFFLLINEIFGQKALPVYDNINYSVGTLGYDNTNWWCLNPSPVNDVSVTGGSLTYSGLFESTGNKLNISGAGDDFVIWFGDRPADSKIYYSLVFQVTDMTGISSGTPAHFSGFSNSATTTSSFGCSIFVQKDFSDPTKFNIGHSTRSSIAPVWNSVVGIPVQYSLNSPIFIVACYEIIGAFLDGTPNDKSSFWINPSSSTFENTVPPTASITGDLTGNPTNDINPLNRFYIRQDAASNTPSIEIDEIRIGSTWAIVTPKSLPTGTNELFNEETGATISPNPVMDIMKVDVKGSGIRYMEVYNLIGRRIMTKMLDQGMTNVDVSTLPQGLYIASFKGSGVTYSSKFIKK